MNDGLDKQGSQFQQSDLAELVRSARVALSRGEDAASALRVLASIASRLGYDELAGMRRLQADHCEGRLSTESATGVDVRVEPSEPDVGRWLVVRPWSAGFFSEVDHLLGWALVAEMTRRRLHVEWSGGFFFGGQPDRNVFECFARPYQEGGDRPGTMGEECFPPSWNGRPLSHEDAARDRRPAWQNAPISYWQRPEAVCVADCFCRPVEVAEWIPPGHRLFGASLDGVYKDLIGRYFVPSQPVADRVAGFAGAMFARPTLAVHIRGSDKVIEDGDLNERIGEQLALVDAMDKRIGAKRVFLLTDSVQVHKEFARRYRQRLVVTPSERTAGGNGVHFEQHRDRVELGRQVLIDALLAARCDAFVGYGMSNVSCFVKHFGGWPVERCVLVGPMMHEQILEVWATGPKVIRRPPGVA